MNLWIGVRSMQDLQHRYFIIDQNILFSLFTLVHNISSLSVANMKFWQALVAGYAFMGYDENNSFRLDRKEVFKTLKLILGQRLPEDKLAALADFVMRQGEHDTSVSKGAFRLDQVWILIGHAAFRIILNKKPSTQTALPPSTLLSRCSSVDLMVLPIQFTLHSGRSSCNQSD